jgi:hypothetical protein
MIKEENAFSFCTLTQELKTGKRFLAMACFNAAMSGWTGPAEGSL